MRIIKPLVLMLLCLLLLLTSCGSYKPEENSGLTWQEQYDLGIRHLSEGGYEDAIIAFTTAIELDSKQALAYAGRGDAHIGIAQSIMSESKELSPEAKASFENAIDDYVQAIDLDNLVVEPYMKVADAYITLGDKQAAFDILTLGYEATGDDTFQQRIDDFNRPESASDIMTVTGTFIMNNEVYREAWENYKQQYGEVSIYLRGIRFPEPIEAVIDGETIFIQEAVLRYPDELRTSLPSETGTTMEVLGYFNWDYQRQEIEIGIHSDGQQKYHYNPNGPYMFYITEVLSVT